MKVVLFCGGLGTRIREYSENIPKPMIPIGNQPILWHIMNYYSQYGHSDFVLCLGYKSNIVKEFFLNYRPHAFADCVVSEFGSKVELLNEPIPDWRVSLIDTGIWRNIGERLWAVRDHVKGEDMFLANYSDGLTDVNLDEMVDRFKRSGIDRLDIARTPGASLSNSLAMITRFVPGSYVTHDQLHVRGGHQTSGWWMVFPCPIPTLLPTSGRNLIPKTSTTWK